ALSVCSRTACASCVSTWHSSDADGIVRSSQPRHGRRSSGSSTKERREEAHLDEEVGWREEAHRCKEVDGREEAHDDEEVDRREEAGNHEESDGAQGGSGYAQRRA